MGQMSGGSRKGTPNLGGTENVTICLPKQVKADVVELSWRRRKSQSQLVTEAVERLLKEAREAGELEAVGA
jgi:Arc/MetJ-type ribon-helix-helix transcriptional regulator